MKRTVLFLSAFFLLPLVASAQQGAIVYERTQQYDFEIPEMLKDFNIPTEAMKPVVLLFNENESLMMEVPPEEQEESGARGGDSRSNNILARMKMGGSRSDNENILEVFHSLVDGQVIESREFMGRTFRIESEQPTYAWKLDGEESEYLGYTVHKATAIMDTTKIEAWFALDIPVEVGPELYSGLPGAILVLTLNEGQVSFKATEISLNSVSAITRPVSGEAVSRDQYEKVVRNKMEEISTMRRNWERGGGRRLRH